MALRVLCRVSGGLKTESEEGARGGLEEEDGHRTGTISLTEEAQAHRNCLRLQVAAPGIEPGT